MILFLLNKVFKLTGWTRLIAVAIVVISIRKFVSNVIYKQWRKFVQDSKFHDISFPALEGHDDGEALKLRSLLAHVSRNRRIQAIDNLPIGTNVWKERSLYRPIVYTRDPKHLRTMLQRMVRSPSMIVMSNFFGPEAIVFQDGSRGFHDRELINKAFQRENLEELYITVCESAIRLRERLICPFRSTEGEIKRTTLEIVCEGGLGYKITDEDAVTEITRLLEIATYPIDFIPFGVHLIKLFHRSTLRFAQKLIGKIVDRRMADQTNGKRTDLLSLYLSVKDDELAEFNVCRKAWLRDQQQFLILAGTDASSSVLTWSCIVLALRPDLQDAVQQELDRLCEPSRHRSEPPSYSQLNQLTYLEGFVKEMLRLYTPSRRLGRVFGADQVPEIDGVPLPRDVEVYFDFQAMHLREDCFSRPKEIIPERWSNMNRDPMLPTATPEAFCAFSYGSRACIGQNFAMVEIKGILGTLLRSHRIVPALDEMKAEIPDGTYRRGVIYPEEPFNVRLVPRY